MTKNSELDFGLFLVNQINAGLSERGFGKLAGLFI